MSGSRELEALEAMIRSGQLDVAAALWKAASSGSVETLELVLQLPNAKEKIDTVPENSQFSPLMAAAKTGSLACVKLLLYHDANLSYSYTNILVSNVTASCLAKKHHHPIVEQYLKKCQTDIQRCGRSRAYLQLTVTKIASNPDSQPADVVEFFDSLRNLVTHCKFDVDSTSDEEGNKYQPLLLRAASSDNSVIVTRLLTEFHAKHDILDPLTGENLLHVCFKKCSKLRFHYVIMYPDLIHQSDKSGKLPLFHACEQNDCIFFCWLLRCSQPSGTPTVVVDTELEVDLTSHGDDDNQVPRHGRMSQHYEEFTLRRLPPVDDVDIPDSPHIAEVVNMRPFMATKSGNSILHVLAEVGAHEILSIIVRVCSHIEGFDFSALCVRRSKEFPLPIEKALYLKNIKCVQVLIDLAINTFQLPLLLKDKQMLKAAVATKNIDNVKTLISFGFHAGIDLAITLAATWNKLEDIVRLLLIWNVVIQNYLDFPKSQSSQALCASKLNWKQLELRYMNPVWLSDAQNITSIATKCLVELKESNSFKENNPMIYQELSELCLSYFESASSIPDISSSSNPEYNSIVSIFLSENHLEELPPELFQLASLACLDVKYNKLRCLPSSDDFSSNLYSAKLESLCLDYNELTSIPDSMVMGLATSLQSLSIQNNKLTDIPPGLWLMPHLTILKLAHNHLSSLHYLSKTHYFNSVELMEKIASLQVTSDGCLQFPANVPDDEAESIAKHMKYLEALYHMVNIIKFPESNFTRKFLLGDLVQVYIVKQYYLEAVNAGEVPTPISDSDVSSFALALTLSEVVFTSNLKFLDISCNSFKMFPWDLQCLAPNLTKLDASFNSIVSLDLVQDLPKSIENVSLHNNKITSVSQERSLKLPCGNPVELLCVNRSPSVGSLNVCRHNQHEILEKLNRIKLDNNFLTKFQVLKNQQGNSQADPLNYPLFPDLAILSLADNKLESVPLHLHRMKHLSSLILSHNPIEELPEDMGLINTDYITLIQLDGIKPSNIPEHLLQSPARKLVKNLKDIKQRAKPHRYMKLMIVGEANKGKTSLLLSLTKTQKGTTTHFCPVEMGINDAPLSTVGVELAEFKYSPNISKPTITFLTWDFGGQEEYYATHQCFLSKRSIYLLLWNIQDGEEGLKKLRPWLENIESCAPQSPVVVVGTHLDKISARDRDRSVQRLETMFYQMYGARQNTSWGYPAFHRRCYFMDVRVRHAKQVVMDQLRDDIYDIAANFRPAARYRGDDTMALLERLVPESYIVLHNFVKQLAENYRLAGKNPILTKNELMKELAEAGLSFEDEFEEVGSFLHENGILLHYDDISSLNDLYFIDPQWLCKMVSKIITIRLKNPYTNKGFMWMKDVTKIFATYAEEFISLLSKFEIVFKLDESRIVIPSFLPDSKEEACLVYSSAYSNVLDTGNLVMTDEDGYDSFGQLDMPIFCRYFLLPFVPNGFFTRLIARLMGSDIIEHLRRSLKGDPLESVHIANTIHWHCWRNCVALVWNRMEIFRVAPLTNTSSSQSRIVLITKPKMQKMLSKLKGLEIKVSIIPNGRIRKCTFLESALVRLKESMHSDGIFSSLDNSDKGKTIAAWLLHKTTSMVDSIFNDWYEGFGWRSFEDEVSSGQRVANYCSQCLGSAHRLAYTDTNVIGTVYMFSSTYCCLAASQGKKVDCPAHGMVKVEDVAPDLAFGDFHPATVFNDSNTFKIETLRPLGHGGFGTVFKATFQRMPRAQSADAMYIAQKKIHSEQITFTEDPDKLAQLKAWSVYQKASTEARVMNELSHKNILALIGICFQPNCQLSILIELAPRGDLQSIVEDEYKSEGLRLSRRTTKATLIQVAEAMEYLHSRNIIYRDLKPQNILVWKFPNPKSPSTSSSVLVKVADYGISSVINPYQGQIRGLDGTEPYQSPEILIYGGRRAYSFHVDVYAFGMCMYFLVAQEHPFAQSHVSVALKEGRRPSIPPKLQPHSVPITDLMCWCWSDLPQDRPDFSQILEVLRSESFTNLLAAAELFHCKSNQVTAMHINSVLAPRLKRTAQKDLELASLSWLMSLVQGKSQSAQRRGETAVQVIYGTDKGRCEMVQFQNSGAVRKAIQIPLKYRKYISSIKVVNDRIWISTVGAGLFVYNANTLQYMASWGDTEKRSIYSLLDLKEMNCIIALTTRGIYSFKTELKDSAFFDYLEYELKCPDDFDGQTMSVGVAIPVMGNTKQPEVWVCSHTERKFFILNPYTLSVTGEVEYSERDVAHFRGGSDLVSGMRNSQGRRRSDHTHVSMIVRIKEMQVVMVGLEVKLAVAENWSVLLWDVESRKMQALFDCREYCLAHQDELPASPNLCNAYITSMDASGDILYVGLENGLILCLKCGTDTISVTLQYHAYEKGVASLMVLQPAPAPRPQLEHTTEPQQDPQVHRKGFRKYYNTVRQQHATKPQEDGPHDARLRSPLAKRHTMEDLDLLPLRYRRPVSLDIHPGSFKVTSSYHTAQNILLASMGNSYGGVTGPHHNCPREFILPSTGLQSRRRKAKAESASHLLIWSTEMCDEAGEEAEEMLEVDDSQDDAGAPDSPKEQETCPFSLPSVSAAAPSPNKPAGADQPSQSSQSLGAKEILKPFEYEEVSINQQESKHEQPTGEQEEEILEICTQDDTTAPSIPPRQEIPPSPPRQITPPPLPSRREITPPPLPSRREITPPPLPSRREITPPPPLPSRRQHTPPPLPSRQEVSPPPLHSKSPSPNRRSSTDRTGMFLPLSQSPQRPSRPQAYEEVTLNRNLEQPTDHLESSDEQGQAESTLEVTQQDDSVIM